jgi:beta-1,4-N-acetylglucosaminyltransferase
MIFSRDVTTADRLVRYFTGVFLVCIPLLLLRICLVYREIHQNRARRSVAERQSEPLSTLIVLGSGGHTTEMLFMTKHLHPGHYHPIHYCKATTDTTSRDRVSTMIKGANKNGMDHNEISIHDIPRSREVGQSYFSSFFSTVYALLFALLLVGRLRPKLLLCNGPGTCIPICVAALLYRILGISYCNIAFIESYCRVQTLSLTGKLLYHGADIFVVHWKELHEGYPDSKLTSTFIQQ